MGRGNKIIDKSMVKTIFEGNILIPLPKLLVGNRYHSMFFNISYSLRFLRYEIKNMNSHYTCSILTSYGTITCNTAYRICPRCKKHFHDEVVGVSGSANYSDELL